MSNSYPGLQALAGDLLHRFRFFQESADKGKLDLTQLVSQGVSHFDVNDGVTPYQIYSFPQSKGVMAEVRVWNSKGELPIYSFNFIEKKWDRIMHSLNIIDLRATPLGYLALSYNYCILGESPVTVALEPLGFISDMRDLPGKVYVANPGASTFDLMELSGKLKILDEKLQPMEMHHLKIFYELFDKLLVEGKLSSVIVNKLMPEQPSYGAYLN